MEQTQEKIDIYVDYYNLERLHTAIGYVAPADKLSGRADEIHAARDEKLRLGRKKRRLAVEMEKEKAYLNKGPVKRRMALRRGNLLKE